MIQLVPNHHMEIQLVLQKLLKDADTKLIKKFKQQKSSKLPFNKQKISMDLILLKL